MAEKRFISRRITESDKIRELANAGKLLPITLYTFLLPYLDREGRMNANPLLLKGGLFEGYPWSIEDLEEAVHELAAVGLVQLYANGRFGHLIQFDKFLTKDGGFNTPHANEAASDLPSPDDAGSTPVQPPPTPANPAPDDAPTLPGQGSDKAATSDGNITGLYRVRVRDRDREGVRENPSSVSKAEPDPPEPPAAEPRLALKDLIEVWNEERGQLVQCRSRKDPQLHRLAESFLKRHRKEPDGGLELFRAGIAAVRDDPTWLRSRAPRPSGDRAHLPPLGLVNYLRHADSKSEAALDAAENTSVKPPRDPALAQYEHLRGGGS